MPRSITGIVTSDKADKTIVITVVTRKTHPLYKKQYSERTKFMAHDETNQAKIGDKVIVSETRPRSTRKRFELVKIVEKASIGFEDSDASAGVLIEEKVKPVKSEEVAKLQTAAAKKNQKTEESK